MDKYRKSSFSGGMKMPEIYILQIILIILLIYIIKLELNKLYSKYKTYNLIKIIKLHSDEWDLKKQNEEIYKNNNVYK
jgi:hypothetical protein